MLGWQVNIASGGYLVAVQIQGLLILNHPSYVFERWHGTLLIIAVTSITMLFNTLFAKKLPLIEGLMLVIHVCGFFAIVIPLWVLAPQKTPARVVFTEFQNNGGWPSLGLSCLIGITSPVFSLMGPDSAVHMGRFPGSNLSKSYVLTSWKPKKSKTPPGCFLWELCGQSFLTASRASLWS